MKRPRIYVFGDSIAMGHWDLEKGGWVERLRLDIEKRYRWKVLVYGLGASGAKMGDFDGVVESEIENRRQDPGPVHVVLQLGANDVPQVDNPKGTALNDFEQSLRNLLAQVQKYDSTLVLGLVKADDNKHTIYSNKNIKVYDNVARRVCESVGVEHIGLFDEGIALDEDGLHPSAEGHRKIYEIVKKEVDENILKDA